MILTLIGMSGTGKSFWTTRFVAHGFIGFDCDKLVARKLQAVAGPVGDSLTEIGRWLGFPDEAGFRQREAVYLACEAEVLREVAAQAARCASQQQQCVIDTGGSAIYADPAIFRQLRQLSTIVYLSVPATIHEQMAHAYLVDPRPLIWNGRFNQAPNEGRDAAVRRCYPQLLRYREQWYEQYSDVKLDYYSYREVAWTVEQFLAAVQPVIDHESAAEEVEG